MSRIAVIGGGVSGLSAAMQCCQHLHEVTLFEASGRVGGVIQTVVRDGWLCERGATTLAEPQPAVKTLLTAAGVDEVMVRADVQKRQRFLLHQGKPVPIPTRVADLVSSPLLSLAGRLRLLKEPFVEQVVESQEESVDSFVTRRLGDEVAENIIDPYLAGSSGGDPTKLLAQYVLPKLVEYERIGGSILRGALRSRRQARRRGGSSGPWSCKQGLQQMLDQLVQFLGPIIRLNSAVHSVRSTNQGFEIVTAANGAEVFDSVICATTAPALGDIQVGMSTSHFRQVASVPCTSMATVSLGFRSEDVGQPLDGAGLLVGSKEARSILDLVFPSALFSGRTPGGTTLVTAHLGGGRRPELVDLSDAELESLVLTDLRDILQVRGAVIFRDIARWLHAMPQTVSGHGARIDAANAIERENPALVLCGAWRDGISIGETMSGGVQAADRLAASL